LFGSWAPQILVDTMADLSFLTHFASITKGVLSFQDLLFFVSFILVWLWATLIVVEMKRGASA